MPLFDTDTGDFLEAGFASGFGTGLAVSGDCKSMRLIADLLYQQQCWRINRKIKRRHFLIENFFVAGASLNPLGDPENTQIFLDGQNIELFQDIERDSQLAFAAVDQDQIGKLFG